MMIMPSFTANVNLNEEVGQKKSYIQIGLETGQSVWDIVINSPLPNLFERTHYQFKGRLGGAASTALDAIDLIAHVGRQHELETRVVYEAGGFGQKLGRDISAKGCLPVQLVARNIEYVRLGGKQDIAKTDYLDAKRQANIPLEHPDLPYADVQSEQEEALRDLFKEKERLEKSRKRINSQMCSILRRAQVDQKHTTVPKWEKILDNLSCLSNEKKYILQNLLSELKRVMTNLETTMTLIFSLTKEMTRVWQPPDPAAQPAAHGRHGLQPLGKNSPLLQKSTPQALLDIKGIGPKTMISILSLIGNPRRFKNKKAFRAYMGLAPTPYRSCTIKKSLGMTRGNPKLRKIMIQLAWRWCSMHPDTHLAKKYGPKLAGSRRSKKIAVCALAGELSEMLYSYLVNGKEIDGLNVKER